MSETATKKSKINVEQPYEFDGLLKSKITTTFELSQVINRLFKPIFHDYEGCTILPDQFGIFQLTLFFKDRGEKDPGKIKNVQSITQKAEKNDIKLRIQNLNRANSASRFELTDETKEALEEFIRRPQNQKVNWKQHVIEVTEKASPYTNAFNVYTKVMNLDLYRILRKIYGGRIDGTYMEYQISMIRPTNQGNATNSNFLINISQLDTKMVEKLYTEMGMVPTQGTFIVRD